MVREQLWLDSVFNSALSCQLIAVNNDAQGEYLRRPYEASSKIASLEEGSNELKMLLGAEDFSS